MKRRERITERPAFADARRAGRREAAAVCDGSRCTPVAGECPGSPEEAEAADGEGSEAAAADEAVAAATAAVAGSDSGGGGGSETKRSPIRPDESPARSPASKSSRPRRTTRTSVTAIIVECRLRSPAPPVAVAPAWDGRGTDGTWDAGCAGGACVGSARLGSARLGSARLCRGWPRCRSSRRRRAPPPQPQRPQIARVVAS